MAQHGYLREYDERPDRGEDRDWADRDRERGWRGGERDWSDRDRGFMFDRDRAGGRDDDRGFFDRVGDRARSWLRDDDNQGLGSPRNFRSHQDDHYRSWRDRQMEALDRDYADYCREREQQFHQDFDSWRRNRQNQGSNEQTRQVGAADEALELNNPTIGSTEPQTGPSPVGEATLGTNNPENTSRGRR